MYLRNAALVITATLWLAAGVQAQNVLEDQGVGMSMQELEMLVKHWPPNMQEAAAIDPGDRIELLSMALANKKIAEQARKVGPEENPERYWENQFVVRNLWRRVYVNNYMEDLQVPDMSALAKERYLAAPDKYALVTEARMSSHILVRCDDTDCDRDEKEELAEQILAELKAGASFESLVEKYSDDKGSKEQGGRFDRWLQVNTQKVEPHYLEGVFTIEAPGDYSDVVASRFGFHIIRLDEIREKHHRPFDEVEPAIVEELTVEYRKLSAKDFDARYRLTEKAYIDQAAMDKLFSPYKPKEHAAQ